MRWQPSCRVELHWGGVFVCEPDWSWSVRELPNLDLWYVVGGVAWIRDRTGETPIAAGDCLLLCRGERYQAGHDRARPLRLICVHFDLVDEVGQRLDPPPAELPPFSRRMEAGGVVEVLLLRAIEGYRAGDRAAASAWLQTALMEVLRQDAQAGPPGLLGEQARKIGDICERIRRQPGLPIHVAGLADELGVSPEHFSRLFRRLQGMPPRAFITKTRIEAARTLLVTSSHPVARIAALLGYDGPFHFSRQFKASVGLAPSAFRRRTIRHPDPAACAPR